MQQSSFFFACVIIFFSNSVAAQTGIPYEQREMSASYVKYINIKPPVFSEVKVTGVNFFKVVDKRADTSSLGYYYTRTGLKRLKVKSSIENAIQSFLMSTIDTSIKDESGKDYILMVIKNLRLSQDIDNDNVAHNDVKGITYSSGGVLAKFEYYLVSGERYFPLYRFDSIIFNRSDSINKLLTFIDSAILLSLNKINKIDLLSWKEKKVSYSSVEMDKYDIKWSDIPVLKDETIKPGVYKTFNEFKINEPSIIKFDIKKDKYSDMLFITEKDSIERPFRFAWGYSDGNNLYVRSGDRYFRLYRTYNTFFFKGYRKINWNTSRDYLPVNPGSRSYYTGPLNGVEVQETYVSTVERFYQLDMGTGKFY